MRHTGFAPVLGDAPKVLILGTFPGLASRGEAQYYAHPRNAFWPVVYQICGGVYAGQGYEQKKAFLMQNGIALWDIVESCETDGSLDTEIKNPQFINLQALLEKHPTIRLVCFNGGNAAKFAKRAGKIPVETAVLPSTSPANARYSLAQKQEKWNEILHPVLFSR